LSVFRLVITYSNIIIIRAIITNFGAQVSNSTIIGIIAIEAKVGISTTFSIVKALVVRSIGTSFIIIKAGSPLPLLLLYIN
jgi:hypothetical protein